LMNRSIKRKWEKEKQKNVLYFQTQNLTIN
jgi:hypothetical protein